MASIELALTSALGLSLVGTGVEDGNAMSSRIETEAGIRAPSTLTVWSVWYAAPTLHMKPSSSLFLT